MLPPIMIVCGNVQPDRLAVQSWESDLTAESAGPELYSDPFAHALMHGPPMPSGLPSHSPGSGPYRHGAPPRKLG